VVPQLAAPRHDDGLLTTCRLTEPSISRTILLLRRRDRSLSPAAAAVWTALRELQGHASEESKSKSVPRAAKRPARSSRHKKPRA
jgi:DNA-binding transcriptional LysR family regulator